MSREEACPKYLCQQAAEPRPGLGGREGERSRAGSELPQWDAENSEVKPAEDSRPTPLTVLCFHTLYHTGRECGNGQNTPMFSGLQGLRETEAVGSRQGWVPRVPAESTADLGTRETELCVLATSYKPGMGHLHLCLSFHICKHS